MPGDSLRETREFFGPRAARWDARFGDDMPLYAAAVAETGVPAAGAAADVGCGTGRALPALRHAVGAGGTVLGFDVTPEMLDAATDRARTARAGLVLADAMRLPLAGSVLDAVFAAGLVSHLPDPADGLRELARVTRPGGRLALFHPVGRAVLAARHGRTLRPDEPLAPGRLPTLLEETGWRPLSYEDTDHRFLAIAERINPRSV